MIKKKEDKEGAVMMIGLLIAIAGAFLMQLAIIALGILVFVIGMAIIIVPLLIRNWGQKG